MVDSRVKGRTGENQAKEELKKYTKLAWERTPLSGALDAKHLLKGDLYVPGKDIKYCIEVKFYKDDHISSKLLTSINPQLIQWWEQTIREAEQINKEPLLLFKYNRSIWFAAHTNVDIQFLHANDHIKQLMLLPDEIYICKLSDFCTYEDFEL